VKDAKTRRKIIPLLAAISALAVLLAAAGAVLVLDRNAHRSVQEEPRTSRSMEMVRPGTDDTAATARDTSADPDSPDPEGTGGVSFSPTPPDSLSPEVYDLTVAVPSGDGRLSSSAAAFPRSLITGTPVYLPDSPEVPPFLADVVASILDGDGDGSGSLPVPPDAETQVSSRVASLQNTVGEADLVYFLESGGSSGHVLIRTRNGQWWHLWIYFDDGRIVDLEYLPASDEG
jgi:hypothetical protein